MHWQTDRSSHDCKRQPEPVFQNKVVALGQVFVKSIFLQILRTILNADGNSDKNTRRNNNKCWGVETFQNDRPVRFLPFPPMKVRVVGVSVKVFISNVKALLLLCIIAVHNTVKLSECNLIVAYFPVCISVWRTALFRRWRTSLKILLNMI